MPARVSVVIPTWNRARYIGQALESALGQGVPGGGVEVIVVDDGSTDDTEAVVAGFGARVRYLRQDNQREGAARNAGALEASGAYLAFLDSDDYWLPGKLAADVERFERSDRAAMVYSRAHNVDKDGRPLYQRELRCSEGDVFWALARESMIPLSTVVVRTDAFHACGGFRPDRDLSGTADWELWMRLAARWPVGFVDRVTTCIRVHPRNMLSDPGWMERAMLSGLRHALADPAVAQRAAGRERLIASNMYLNIALNASGNGLRAQSGRWLRQSAATWPRIVADPRFLVGAARILAGPVGQRAWRARHS